MVDRFEGQRLENLPVAGTPFRGAAVHQPPDGIHSRRSRWLSLVTHGFPHEPTD